MSGRGESAPAAGAPRARRLWKWGDLLAAAVVLVAALASALALFWPRQAGQAVVVQTPSGDQVWPLNENAVYDVAGNGGLTLTVEVADGRVRVRAADCPDQVCVHTGWLSRDGDVAACVPAGVSVRVSGGAESPVDAVTW